MYIKTIKEKTNGYFKYLNRNFYCFKKKKNLKKNDS